MSGLWFGAQWIVLAIVIAVYLEYIDWKNGD